MTRLIHVTRLPPSPSGVALYARDLDEAYRRIVDLTIYRMPADPRGSQSFGLAIRTWWRLRRQATRRSDSIVAFELAGRCLAEMWAAWALALSHRRVWVTIHDVPTVCGPAFLPHALDRPGLRRLGMFLSRAVGRPAERSLLRRADAVYALSRAGARALSHKYRLTRPITDLPHVVAAGEGLESERRILIPGYVGSVDSVLPLVRALPTLPSGWRLVVGAASPSVSNAVTALATQLGVTASVDLLGFVDEGTVDREFGRASIVVRWREEGWLSGRADYAVSGPLIRAMARGCAIVTNDRRGVHECLEAAGVTIVGDGKEGEAAMLSTVSHFVEDRGDRLRSAEAGLAHIAAEHSLETVTARLAGLVQ